MIVIHNTIGSIKVDFVSLLKILAFRFIYNLNLYCYSLKKKNIVEMLLFSLKNTKIFFLNKLISIFGVTKKTFKT